MPVRNEGWILGMSARVALLWCDELVVGLHACTDTSQDIIRSVMADHPGRVHLIHHPDPMWDEMRHRQESLEIARQNGATHIAIVDADEVMTANLTNSNTIERLRFAIEYSATGSAFQLPLYQMRNGTDEYHENGIWGHRWVTVAFPDNFSMGWSGDKFHCREPRHGMPEYRPFQHGAGGVLHYWGACERRLVAKHALYKVTERLRWPNKSVAEIDQMYSLAIFGNHASPAATWQFSPVPDEWKRGVIDQSYYHPDGEPWQEAEVRRLMREHGAAYFAGLNLFGVA